MAIIPQHLALRFQQATDCSPQKAQEHTQQYIWLCGLEMMRNHFADDAGSRYYINASQLQNKLNTLMVHGKRHYVWKVFQSFPERIFTITQTGTNLTKELSMAQAHYTMEEVLLAAGTPEELAVEIYKPYAEQIAQDDCDYVSINMRSLENYIKSNLSNDRNRPGMSQQLIEELDRNLKHAQRIWMLATANNGTLCQVRSDSAFGRRYYRGPNLQNIPKTVRHVALGHCHEYDIESSVFAWKLSWFRDICQQAEDSIAMPATLEYLDHKVAIRKKLAQTVFDTQSDWAVNVIKEFITAIGFGAPARSVGYRVDNHYQKPALATILYPKERLDRALADPWVAEFIEEQKKMNAVIIGYGQITGQEPTWRTVPELVDKANRLRPNSVIAYLYQQHERKLLDWAEEFCADREVLLTVHDCIYTRHPVKLAEFRAGIQQFGSFFKLNHEEHDPWGWQDPVDPADPFYDPRDQIVAQQAQRYADRRGVDFWNGSGHDGTGEYDLENDPYFDEESAKI